MTQNPTPEILKLEDKDARKQGGVQDSALQKGSSAANRAVQERMQPRYPEWPTSQRGPMSTPPPPGTRPINPMRSEQVAEVGYNQETGEPGTQGLFGSTPDETLTGQTSSNQTETAQEALGKRKERL
jgi:hypothetical protein